MKVCVCCIAKMENLYIKEYVEYYYNLGVDKIVLYDNNEIDGEHFRRCIFGIYHHVSVKHLQKYIDEMVLRWNTRKATEGDRFAIMLSRSLGIVSFKDIRGCATDNELVDMLEEGEMCA